MLKSPQSLAETFTAVNKKLSDYAHGTVSPTEAVEFFNEVDKEISQTKKDYQSAVTSLQPLK